MSWFVLTILAMFSTAIADISQKISLTNKNNISSVTNNFIVWGLIGILSLIYAIVFKIPFPDQIFSYQFILGITLISSIYFWGGTFFYTSFKSNSVSLSVILATISSVVSTFLGILFFSESTNWLKILGSALIFIAIFLINWSRGSKLDKYNCFALLGGGFYGLAFTLDKFFVLSTSPNIYQIFLCFGVAIASLVFKGKMIRTELKLLSKSLWKSIVSSIVFFLLYQKFIFTAYAVGGEVGRIDVLNNGAIFIIILFELLFLKDRSRLFTKIISGTIAVVGASILVTAA